MNPCCSYHHRLQPTSLFAVTANSTLSSSASLARLCPVLPYACGRPAHAPGRAPHACHTAARVLPPRGCALRATPAVPVGAWPRPPGPRPCSSTLLPLRSRPHAPGLAHARLLPRPLLPTACRACYCLLLRSCCFGCCSCRHYCCSLLLRATPTGQPKRTALLSAFVRLGRPGGHKRPTLCLGRRERPTLARPIS